MLRVDGGADEAVLVSVNGVQNERKIWLAPAGRMRPIRTPGSCFSTDQTALPVSTSAAMTSSCSATRTRRPSRCSKSRPASRCRRPGPWWRPSPGGSSKASMRPRTRSTSGAARGLFAPAAHPGRTDRIEEVALPVKGHIDELFSDARQDGVTLSLSSWVVAADRVPLRSRRQGLQRHPSLRPRRHRPGRLQGQRPEGQGPRRRDDPAVADPAEEAQRAPADGDRGLRLLWHLQSRRLLHPARPVPARGGQLRPLRRARRRRAGRGLAVGRQGRQQAQHLAGSDLLRRGSDRPRRHRQGQAVHLGRLGRRHHGGPGDDRPAGPVRRGARSVAVEPIRCAPNSRRTGRTTFPSSARSPPSRGSRTSTTWTRSST